MDRRTAIKNIALSLGLTISTPTLLSLFTACKESDGQWQFFSRSQQDAVSHLVDIIIPTTDTPGARDLQVDHFVDKLCAEVLTPQQQTALEKGFFEYTHRLGQRLDMRIEDAVFQDHELMLQELLTVSPERSHFIFELLQYPCEDITEPVKPDYNLYTFLTTVRELTLLGYFTSLEVMEQTMNA